MSLFARTTKVSLRPFGGVAVAMWKSISLFEEPWPSCGLTIFHSSWFMFAQQKILWIPSRGGSWVPGLRICTLASSSQESLRNSSVTRRSLSFSAAHAVENHSEASQLSSLDHSGVIQSSFYGLRRVGTPSSLPVRSSSCSSRLSTSFLGAAHSVHPTVDTPFIESTSRTLDMPIRRVSSFYGTSRFSPGTFLNILRSDLTLCSSLFTLLTFDY